MTEEQLEEFNQIAYAYRTARGENPPSVVYRYGELVGYVEMLLVAEREACAKVVESWATEETATTCTNIAEAIRARK